MQSEIQISAYIVGSMKSKDYWLGLARASGSHDWIWSDCDQSPLTHENWRPDRPDLIDTRTTVAYADSNDNWVSTHVGDQHLVYCEFFLTSGKSKKKEKQTK